MTRSRQGRIVAGLRKAQPDPARALWTDRESHHHRALPQCVLRRRACEKGRPCPPSRAECARSAGTRAGTKFVCHNGCCSLHNDERDQREGSAHTLTPAPSQGPVRGLRRSRARKPSIADFPQTGHTAAAGSAQGESANPLANNPTLPLSSSHTIDARRTSKARWRASGAVPGRVAGCSGLRTAVSSSPAQRGGET